jgi:L-fucose mutarotase
MLKGISHLIGPDLLRILHQMGHGDRLTLADAHFPGHSLGPQVVRADGLEIAPLLTGILALLHLEESQPLTLMEFDADFVGDPHIGASYLQVAERFQPALRSPLRLQRQEFYNAARTSFAIVMTGDTRPYGNLILTKGVTPRGNL